MLTLSINHPTPKTIGINCGRAGVELDELDGELNGDYRNGIGDAFP